MRFAMRGIFGKNFARPGMGGIMVAGIGAVSALVKVL